MRLIQTLQGPSRKVNVYRDAEWNEYVVRVFDADVRPPSNYYTDDKADALSTAAHLFKEAP